VTQFTAQHYEAAFPDGVEHHWWHVARKEIVFRQLDANERVLDVGCGRGIVVQSLRERGIDAAGVEIGPAVPLRGVEAYVRSNTDAVDLPPHERDRITTILLLDVIEHIAEPVELLRRILDAFTNVTKIVIAVPARNELWSSHDEFYGHFRRYSLRDIDELARALNLRRAWSSYFFHALYLPLRAMSLLKHKRSESIAVPSNATRWIHRLLAKLFVIEYRLLPRAIPGSSIIATLERHAASG
jgi:SAM-dependent methyltransferase